VGPLCSGIELAEDGEVGGAWAIGEEEGALSEPNEELVQAMTQLLDQGFERQAGHSLRHGLVPDLARDHET